MSSYEFQFSDYNRIILKQFRFIFIVVSITTVAGLIIGRIIPQSYKETSVIQADFDLFFEGAQVDSWMLNNMEDNLGSMMVDITGYPVLLKTAQSLGRVADSISVATVIRDQTILTTIESIREMISLKPIPELKQIEIIVTSKNPNEPGTIANALSAAYRDFSYKNKKDFFEEKKKHITQNLEQYRDELSSITEQMVEVHTQQQDLVDDEFHQKKEKKAGDLEKKKQHIDYLLSSITAQHTELLDMRERLQKYNQQTIDSIITIDNSPDHLPDLRWIEDLVYRDPGLHMLNRRLIDLRDQRTTFLHFYLPNHPMIIALNGQLLNTIDELLAALVRTTISLQQENSKVITLIDTISDLLDRPLKHQLSSENALEEMQTLYNLKEQSFESFETELAEMQMMIDGLIPYIHIVTEARYPPISIGLGTKKTGMLGIVAGIALGVILSIFREIADRSFSNVDEVNRVLNDYPILSVIPVIKFGKRTIQPTENSTSVFNHHFKTLLPVLFNPTASISESFQILAAQLGLQNTQRECAVVMITSSIAQEGKTLIAANLSLALALQGYQSMLVEADFRRPSMAPLFGLPPLPGLSDLLVESKSLDTCRLTISDLILGKFDWTDLVKIHGINNFGLITHGSVPPNPAEILGSNTMTSLLDELKNDCNYIILDCPTIASFADSMIVARYCSGIVMVYRSNGISRELLQTNIHNLESTGTQVLGLALNAWHKNEADAIS